MLGGNTSFHKPISKITNNPHHDLAVQLDAAKRDYLEPILAELTEGSFHPLDLMQAVNGSFDGQFPGLEMSTSPGGEYGCKKGDLMDDVVFGPTPKQPLPNTHYMDMANPYPNGQRVFWPKRELLEKMEVYKEAIRKGSMSAISYNSALKDEAVALDKTRARVFFIGDVAVTILIRTMVLLYWLYANSWYFLSVLLVWMLRGPSGRKLCLFLTLRMVASV
jgi:hypothetical protein